jgi:cytochrome P450
MAARFDLASDAFFRDPAVAVAAARASSPVVPARYPLIGNVWITTTHEATARVLKDAAAFPLRKNGAVAGLRWWMPKSISVFADNMLTSDEPDHTRLRSLVDEAFRRRAVMEMEPNISAIASDLAGQLFAEGTPADLVMRYARILSLSVICELLGLPLADRPTFIGWANMLATFTTPLGFVRTAGAMKKMRRYMDERLKIAHEQGGEGLIAELARLEKEGGRISHDELVTMLFLLLIAGSETTTHLISGAVFELLKDPARRDWLEADWSRAGLAVEEFLRFVSPVQLSKPRFVREDMELEGVRLKKGDRIMALIVAANFDPAANDHPERLELERRPNKHLSFGTGIHFCLGNQLARMEAVCGLRALFTRHPKLRLAVDAAEIRWRRRPGLRAIEKLPVMA